MGSARHALVLVGWASLLAAPSSGAAQGESLAEAAPEPSAGEAGRLSVIDLERPLASAREREAALRTEAGWLALSRGQLARALEDFEAGWQLAPTSARFWARVRVLDGLRRDAALVEAYRDYLEWAAPEDPQRAEVEARLAVLGATRSAPEPASTALVSTESAPSRPTTVLDEPWFWAVVAVAAAAGLGALLFTTGSSGAEAPIPGDEGVVVRTLLEVPLP